MAMRRPKGAPSAAWSTLQWLRSPYPYLDRLARIHGETFTLPLFGFPLAVFSNPDHVREVFADAGDEMLAGPFNQTLAPLLGSGSVLMADGKPHRRKRKLLLPPFHGERMQSYGQTMLDETDAAIDDFPHGRPFALHDPMQDITLRVIIRTIFGFDGGPEATAIIGTLKEILDLGSWSPLLVPFMQVDLGPLSHYGRFRKAQKRGDELLYREIARRRRDGTRGNDVLSLLLDARDEDGEPMGDEELRDELVTLLVAGHETTATGLTWAMRWLLADPALLGDLEDEVSALGPSPAPERLAQLPLLDATVREALRLVPIIPIVGRVLAKDHTLGGYELCKGDVVVCSIYLAHRRPEAYPDPTRFDPRRFLGRKMSAQEFFPFGGGMRRCIGMQFALWEMKMVLARLVARTELALATKDIAMVRRSVTITPGKGLPVILKQRRLAA